MQLRIYDGEHFERGIVWQVLAGIIFVGLLVLTLFGSKYLGGNETWIPGWTDVLSAVLFLAMFVAYRWYVRKEIEKKVVAEITEEALLIGTHRYQRHAVQGFSLENKRETGDLYSIIFRVNHHNKVHTLVDEKENIIAFAKELQTYTTFVEEMSFSWFDTLLRRCKV